MSKIILTKITTPDTPTSGKIALYAKTNDRPYLKTDTGIELGLLTVPDSAGIDGWTPVTGTWTYASASTITVPSGAAAIYQVGDRIKWTQAGGTPGTERQGVIMAVADTLLTILTNVDFVVEAGKTIALPYYSHQQNPLGYKHWFACAAPSFTVAEIDNGSGGQPTISEYRAKVDGHTYSAHLRGNGVKATAAPYFHFTSPVACINTTTRCSLGPVYINGAGDSFISGAVINISDTAFYIGSITSMADNEVLTHFGFTISFEI